ncbi:MAG: NAD-dependent epimerase/dehydratase family protein [Croceimicrobium sp.]
MQTILGAGDVIGNELTKALAKYNTPVRLVARNPKTVMGNEELFSADLMDAEATLKAVEGSSVVYLTIGLQYNRDIWRKMWPQIMQNVIKACHLHQANLVFFDNIYCYHPEGFSDIREDHPKKPVSEKGKVRHAILEMLWQAHKAGEIKATVARSADFYGPNAGAVSVLNEGVLKPLKANKRANWFGGAHYKHSFTYTIDAAKATAMLGNSEIAWGEEWHLPTAKNALTGQEFVEKLAALTGAKPKMQVAGPFLLSLVGLFVPIMKEFKEMLYQYDRDYIFNSDKFEAAFEFNPTSYDEGLKSLI